MNEVSLCQEQEADLAAALRLLWKQAHGVPVGDVRALAGPDSVAVWIEDVFSPAERALARSIEGQVVFQRYTGQLLATIQPDLRAQVEAITGHRIVSGNVNADVDTGGVICFFILGERLTSPPDVTTPNAASSP